MMRVLFPTLKEDNMDITQIASAVAAIVAPFAPYLIDVGKAVGKKMAETIAAKGGEAAWSKAQSLWSKIKARLGDDPEVKSAALMLAGAPDDETYQTLLTKVLAKRLEQNPDLARELLDLLGGEKAAQRVLAERGSRVTSVMQEMQGSGEQIIHASDRSTIEGVTQKKKKR
ncbi:MAG TPA: hypothetical protein VJ793_23355 [Anaerolineae bacterium]|nr:hypothetical protein [Anaerolineae bacterium]